MKKFIFLSLLMLMTLASYSQNNATLNETVYWIKKQIESYPSCGTLCYTAKVEYKSYLESLYVTYTSNWGNTTIFIIHLAKIDPHGYSYTKGYQFAIRTFGKEIIQKNIDSKGKVEILTKDIAYLVFDDESFQRNNLEPRLIEAFNHACLLLGGKVSPEPF
jgi:hypothetical protein